MHVVRIIAVVYAAIFLSTDSHAASQKPFYETKSYTNSINICGTVLYMATNNGAVEGISLKDGKPVKFTFEKSKTPLGSFNSPAYFVLCELERGWVAASSSNGKLILFDTGLNVLSTYDIPETHSYAAAFMPGDFIILGTVYGTVRALKLPGLSPAWSVKANWDAIKTVSVSPDGKLFATGSNDSRIHIRSTADGKKVKTLRGHKDGIYTLSWSSDGKHILSGSKDRRLLYWNVETGGFLELHQDFTYIYAAMIVENDLAVASTNENEVSLFSVSNNAKLATFKGHSTVIASVTYGDGYIYSGSANGEIFKWDIRKYLKNINN